jgi:hypothetical protein
VPATGLYDNPQAWRGVTWRIVEAFKAWQLQQGYAIGSIDGRLSTVRTIMDPWLRPPQFLPGGQASPSSSLCIRPNEQKLPLVHTAARRDGVLRLSHYSNFTFHMCLWAEIYTSSKRMSTCVRHSVKSLRSIP